MNSTPRPKTDPSSAHTSCPATWRAALLAAALLWANAAVAAETAVETDGPVEAPAADTALADASPAEDGAPDQVENGPEEKGFLGDYDSNDVPEAPSSFALLGRLIGSLAVVVGLIVLSAFVFKRMLAKSRQSGGQGHLVNVLQVTPLGGKRQIYVVRVAGRLLVVGAGGDNLSLLAELPDTEEHNPTAQPADAPDDLVSATPGAPERSSFFHLLKSVGRQISTGGAS